MRFSLLSFSLCLIVMTSNAQFITTWDVGNDFTINIPTFPGETYNYNVDWDNDGIIDDTNVTGDISHTYPNGTTEVTVSISGTFPRIYINNSVPERIEILSINQWGNNPWTSMGSAFRGCAYIEVLASDTPDLSNVTDCSLMFRSANNLGDGLQNWDVSNVEDFSFMFQLAQNFNGDISGWQTTSAIDMTQMFDKALDFDQNISGWDTEEVTSMFGMFFQCPIDQNLGLWDISGQPDMTSMFALSPMSTKNYDLTLAGWASQNIGNITFGAGNLKYCNSKISRDSLIANGWIITGDSESCGTNDFVTTWNTTLPGTSNNNQITIPILGSAQYSYDVDWDNDGTYDEYGITGSVTHTYATSGIKTIRIKGQFPRMFTAGTTDANKLLSIDQWGCISWQDMTFAFSNCNNMNILATDAPDLSKVTSMSSMLRSCTSLTASINHWDVSNVSNFSNCFRTSNNFNSPLDNWDVSNAILLSSMFNSASSFNQDISGWQTGGVSLFQEMFKNASAMDQDLSGWDINSATNISEMLDNSGFSLINYDKMLIEWYNNTPPNGLNLGASGLEWCNADQARDSLLLVYGWTITGDNRYCQGDDPNDPILLDVDRLCNFDSYNYIGYTNSEHMPTPICGNSTTDDMWFTCTVPTSSLLILDFNFMDDHIVSVYKNSTAGTLIDCYVLGPNDKIRLEEDAIAEGEELFIQVYRTSTENMMDICAFDPQLNCTNPTFPQEEQFVTASFLNWTPTDTIGADSYNVYYASNENLGFIGNSPSLGIIVPADSTLEEGLRYWKAVPVRDGVESNYCSNNTYYNTAVSEGTMVCDRDVYLKINEATCQYNITVQDVSNQAQVMVISGLPESAIVSNGTTDVLILANNIPSSFANPIIIDSYASSNIAGRGCITEGYLSLSANCGVTGFDNDGDGITFDDDNCPEIANPTQSDMDGDGVGDACDNCMSTPNPSQSDFDDNGIGDVCDSVGNLQTTDNVGIGVTNPNFKLEVGGSLFINSNPSTGALIMKSEDGSCWRMVVTNEGTINLVKTDCGE